MTDIAEAAKQLHQVKYRGDIDGLRAVAVLSVVGFHAFPRYIPGGFVGVDVFFVISGYLISTIIFKSLTEGSFSFRVFYARRIKRIFPALIVVLAACAIFGWFTLMPDEYEQLGKHIAGGSAFVSNLVLWSESGYFDNAAETKPLLHLWSLGIEEQFYIVWPLLLFFVWKRRLSLLLLAIAVLVCSFVSNVLTVSANPVATFYSPATRVWELMFGGVLAYATLHKADVSRGAHIQAVIGIALIVIAVGILNKRSAFPGWWALLPTVGALLLIAAGPKAWVNRVILSNRLMVWFGLISFPLYLWHWPLLAFARITGEASRSMLVAAVFASIALAALTYRFVERPIRFGAFSRVRVASLCVLVLMLGCVGYGLYADNGIQSRFSPLAQEVARFQYNPRVPYREGSCFLDPVQDKSAFSDICIGKARVFLWGDSHAAQLYPGLGNTVPGNAQYTKAGCPPLLRANLGGRSQCKAVNDYVFGLIARYKPDRVIVAGAWGAPGAYDWRLLGQTMTELKQAGIKHIDLVGPVPQWTRGLPRTLVTYLTRNSADAVPERMSFGLDHTVVVLDERMRAFAARHEVT